MRPGGRGRRGRDGRGGERDREPPAHQPRRNENEPDCVWPSAALIDQRALYLPELRPDFRLALSREILRGSRPPLPSETFAPPLRLTLSVPLRTAWLNVAVTERMPVLALPPRAGFVDSSSVCAATATGAGPADFSVAVAPEDAIRSPVRAVTATPEPTSPS